MASTPFFWGVTRVPIRDLDELSPDARAEVQRYLDELEAGFCAVAREVASEALDDVRMHLLERLDASASVERVRTVLADFGEPDEYAKALCAEVSVDVEDWPRLPQTGGLAEPRGRLLGMPYDLKAPTPANLQSRMWNPADPRVFTPRLIGLGWSINFAALAVKAGFIRPDDEDEPFGSVPETALWGALFVPIVVCGAVVIASTLSWPNLPDQLPVHWGFDGRPDDFASPQVALWPLIALAVVPTGYAIWTFVVGRGKAARAVTVVSATILAVLSAGLVTAVLAEANEVVFGWAWPWVLILLALGVPFVMLFALSRLGHANEVRRDLERQVRDSEMKGRES